MKLNIRSGVAIIAVLTAISIIFSSCGRDRYQVDPGPPPPTGYQYVFDDNFDYDAHNWSFSDNQNSAFVNISGGKLNYTYTPAVDGANTVAVDAGLNTAYDFLIQTSIASDNKMGLAFGVSNYDYGYSFFIDDQGYFAVYKEGDANNPATTIIDWTYDASIKAGWNNIELEQVGSTWQGYVNGTQVFNIPAQSLRGSKVGYIVLAGTRGQADYLTIQW